MNAVVISEYGGPEVLTLTHIPKPQCGPGRILVKFHAAGVNPVDTYLRSGAQGYEPKLPYTPGMDGAGTVEEVGDGVIGFDIGMRVYCAGSITGTYAEYGLCAPNQLFKLPDELNWSEGASLGVPYFTAARALFTRGSASAGDVVLVHGASGGVGSACLQLAAGKGMTVFGTAGSTAGAALVALSGARCFDHRDPGRFDALREASGGRGVDLIIEMLANVNLDDDLKLLSPGGRVVVVGSRGRIEITPRDLMSVEGDIRGLKMPNTGPEDRRDYAKMIEKGIRDGYLKPPIAGDFSLGEAGAAHETIISGPHSGHLVLVLDENE
ncbi:MAG: NADPH:quinone reductase [Spirochaetaceae bacterium]|nr:NADPH:quinone reductase [Spirochaetaceae bacterium]MDT8298507.1 NADPH:quinone reductase [Spirochaetaceae bacterium]